MIGDDSTEFAKYIKVKKSKIHGRGLFTSVDIPAGEKVIEYIGERISKAESERRSDAQLEKAKKSNTGAVYIFTLNKKTDVDGNVPYNRARLINHSCDPNCESDIIRGRIYILSRKFIPAGTELTYDYGFNIDDYTAHPCHCGAANCIGFIVSKDKWGSLKRKLAKKAVKKTKKAKAKKKTPARKKKAATKKSARKKATSKKKAKK